MSVRSAEEAGDDAFPELGGAGQRLDVDGDRARVLRVGRVLRDRYPHCKVIAVEPESCATISRGERGPTKIQGIAAGFIPKNFDARVPTEAERIEAMVRIARFLER